MGRRVLCGAGVIASALLCQTAAADEANVRALRLRYAVPTGCPSRTWFEGNLHFRSSRVVAVGPEESGDYDADVSVEATGAGFRGSLTIAARGGAATAREIEGSVCATVVDALGFTIALLVDPDNVNTAVLPSEAELARLAETARTKPPPPSPAPVAPAGAAPRAPANPPPEVPNGEARSGFGVLAELGAGAWSAVRDVAPRAHLTMELRRDAPRVGIFVRLGGVVGLPDEVTAAAGKVSYFPTAGRLDGGASWRLTPTLRAGAGAHLTTLFMPVDAPETDEPRPSMRIVPSLGPLLRASWEPGAIGFGLEVAGGVPTTRERFQIESSGEAREVFRLPAVWGQATIGVVVRFLDPRAPFGR